MSFAEINWLLSLPVALAVLALFYWGTEVMAAKRLRRFASAQQLPSLLIGHSLRRRIIKLAIVTLGISCGMLSLARPRWGYEMREHTVAGVDVLIAVDVSRSMLAEDLVPNRLERSKMAIHDLTAALQGDRIGLIAFAGTAFLVCPFTADYDGFASTVSMLGTNSIPIPGSDIGGAIREARATFPKGENQKILILISDGEDLEADGIREARLAADEGIQIHTIGVGSADGELIRITDSEGRQDFVRDSTGTPIRTRLDEVGLRQIAEATGGSYTNLVDRTFESIYLEAVEGLAATEREMETKRLPIERYQWPLAAAIALLVCEWLIPSRRREGAKRRKRIGKSSAIDQSSASSSDRMHRHGVLGLVLLATVWLSALSPLEGADAWRAQRLYNKGAFEDSAALYRSALEEDPDNAHLRYNLGVSLFEAGRYAEASDSFEAAVRTDDLELQRDAYFNRGNSLYNQARILQEEDPHRAQSLWLASIDAFAAAHSLDAEDREVHDRLAFAQQQFEVHSALVRYEASPPEGGHVEGPEVGIRYLRGTEIALTAHPADGWRFARWTGIEPEDPANPELSFQLADDVNILALFVRTRKLSVLPSPEFAGKVGVAGQYDEGTNAPLQAEAIEGYAFRGWSGAPVIDAEEAQTEIYMNDDAEVIASFARVNRFVVRANDPNAGTASGTGDHPPGSTVAIQAVPAEGFQFSHWESPAVHDRSAPETQANVPPGEHDVVAVFVSNDQNQDESESEDESESQQEQNSGQDSSQDNSESGDESTESSENESQQEESADKNSQTEDGSDAQSEKDAESSEAEEDNNAAPDESEQQESDGSPAESESAAGSEEANASEGEEHRSRATQLTPAEARLLLETIQRQEKLLPLGEQSVSESERERDRRGRDW